LLEAIAKDAMVGAILDDVDENGMLIKRKRRHSYREEKQPCVG